MAKKSVSYFSHDSNARQDPKISEMRSVYGAQGYGWYWILIELMREQKDYKLQLSSKYAFNAFASQMGCDSDTAKQFIDDCVREFHLFESDDHSFWSNSLLQRMLEMEEKSVKAKKSAEARWGKKAAPNEGFVDSSNKMQSESDANASKEDAIKEKKLKEIKLKEIKDSNGDNRVQDSLQLETSNLTKPFEENPIIHSPTNVFGIYEREIGELSQIVCQKLISLEEDFTEMWLKKAIEVAVFAGEKKMRFIEGVLRKWEKLKVDEPWNIEIVPETNLHRARSSPPRQHGLSRTKIQGILPSSVQDNRLSNEELEKAREQARKLDERLNNNKVVVG
ncbi:DUF4373 domain-containing protein [Paenibacillus sp. CGMCC 1.16610]|uniref:DUF4373 domain-containing protein n=1 Tax=Paenibacillus anseongense TaxID=2682845 RepID=A0ABW9U2B7_9BACL|nr:MULTISPECIES: Lin1244/Lin1753 domain-containing protein [Paenibacillus]MBA2943189.1 DUF4373 domain-containing protein [Paenibacillus sp. CGMCC 1.16610]MVQ33686.1 DUF4373 domain-containing protein [Paenibacillus anseongense]